MAVGAFAAYAKFMCIFNDNRMLSFGKVIHTWQATSLDVGCDTMRQGMIACHCILREHMLRHLHVIMHTMHALQLVRAPILKLTIT